MRLKVCTGILLLVVIQVAFAFPKGRKDDREPVEDGVSLARKELRTQIKNPEMIHEIARQVPKTPVKRYATPLFIQRKHNRMLLKKQVAPVSSSEEKEETKNVRDEEGTKVEQEKTVLTHSTAQQVVPEDLGQLEEQQDEHITEIDDDGLVHDEDEVDIDAGGKEIEQDEHVEVIDASPEVISQTSVQDAKEQPEDIKHPEVVETTPEQKPSEDSKVETVETVAITSEKKEDQPTPKKKKGRKNITKAQTTKYNGDDVNSLIRGSKAYRDACKWCHPAFSFSVHDYPCWEQHKLANKYICYPQCDHCVNLQPFCPYTQNGMIPWSGHPHMPHLPIIPGSHGTIPRPGGVKPIKDKEDHENTTDPREDCDEEEEEDDDDDCNNHDLEEDDEKNGDSEKHEKEEEDEEEEKDEEDDEEDDEEEEGATKTAETDKVRNKKNKKGVCTCYCRKKGKKGCQYIKIGSGKRSKKGHNVYVVIVN